MIEGLSKARMSSVLPIFSDCSRLFLVSVINFSTDALAKQSS